MAAQFTDVNNQIANFSSSDPAINVTIRLDSRGHLAIANAVVVSNAPEKEAASGGVADTLKGLFGKKDKTNASEVEEEVDDKSKAASKSKPKAEKKAIKFREKPLGIKPMTGEEKRITMAR